jgi:hypothetical protein
LLQDFGYILLQAQKDFEKVRQRLDAIPLEAIENDLVSNPCCCTASVAFKFY